MSPFIECKQVNNFKRNAKYLNLALYDLAKFMTIIYVAWLRVLKMYVRPIKTWFIDRTIFSAIGPCSNQNALLHLGHCVAMDTCTLVDMCWVNDLYSLRWNALLFPATVVGR